MNSSASGYEHSRGETTRRMESCLAKFDDDFDDAFNSLIELVYERFHRLAAHILNQQFEVLGDQFEDAYHDALLDLRTALKNRNVAPKTKAELCGLAARKIRFALLDLVKRFRRDEQHVGIEDVQDSVQQQFNAPIAHTTLDPARLAAWTEFQESIAGLEPKLRELVEFRFYLGLPHQEIADILDVPLTTVQKRWQSARVELAFAGRAFLPD